MLKMKPDPLQEAHKQSPLALVPLYHDVPSHKSHSMQPNEGPMAIFDPGNGQLLLPVKWQPSSISKAMGLPHGLLLQRCITGLPSEHHAHLHDSSKIANWLVPDGSQNFNSHGACITCFS